MNALLPPQPGIRVTLAELIEMRHRVREVQLFSTPSQRSPLIGLHHSKLRGRGVDFDQVRVYQAGDDVRTIDWRVTARTQEPHTKLFHEERERPIFIMVEQSRRLFFGSGLMFKSVLAAQAASLIGWAALGHNDRVGGLVFGDNEHYEIKPRRSKQSLLQLLNRLVRVNQSLHTEREPDRDAFGIALRREHRLEHQSGAEKQPRALLDHDENRPLAFFMEQFGMGFLGARGHAPVDGAHIVAGLIHPHLVEVDAAPAKFRVMQADQRAALARRGE